MKIIKIEFEKFMSAWKEFIDSITLFFIKLDEKAILNEYIAERKKVIKKFKKSLDDLNKQREQFLLAAWEEKNEEKQKKLTQMLETIDKAISNVSKIITSLSTEIL